MGRKEAISTVRKFQQKLDKLNEQQLDALPSTDDEQATKEHRTRKRAERTVATHLGKKVPDIVREAEAEDELEDLDEDDLDEAAELDEYDDEEEDDDDDGFGFDDEEEGTEPL